MNTTLKILSLLLSYPTVELQREMPALREALCTDLEAGDVRDSVVCLMDDMTERDLIELQERYVFWFDRTRVLSLHLFEHVHGENRDRGQAMVDLLALYQSHGLTVDARELPDYLPVFLEFASTRPQHEIQSLLGQITPILSALSSRLQQRESDYAAVFQLLLQLSADLPDRRQVEVLLQTPEDDPADLDALDRIWTEEVVSFGSIDGEQSVPIESLRSELRSRRAVAPSKTSAGVEG